MKVLLNPQTIAALNTKFAVIGIPLNVSLIALLLANIEGINIKVYEDGSLEVEATQEVVKVNAVEAVHSYLPHKTIIIPAEDIIEAQNSVICRHKYVPQLLQVLPKLLKAQVLNQCE